MKIPVAETLALLHGCAEGALATHSVSVPGYPFVTALPFALDACHRPWFLMSALAEHCRNVQADGRVSLLLQSAGGAVLTARRMTLVGEVVQRDPDDATRNRLLRYCPAFADYLQLGDFRFYCLQPGQVRYIAGFGRMGWQDAAEWQDLVVLDAAEEDHLLAVLSGEAAPRRLLGVDAYGLDLDEGDRRIRLDVPDAANLPQAAREQALRQALHAWLAAAS